MTLKEAVEHLDEILQSDKEWACEECKNEHIALRDWLKELKVYKDLDKQGKLYRGWIPCSESLPEEYKGCLVSLKNGEVFRAYYSVSWGFQVEIRDICENNPVIAWQPLPEPYKPGEED